MNKRFEEAMERFIDNYKYRRKILSEDAVELNVNCYPIGDKAKFYLISADQPVGSIFTTQDTTIISEYEDGESTDREEG